MTETSKPTLSQRVADDLRRLILSGEVAPGTRLRQIEWAERLGVSPTPVREAFKLLANQGLVRYDAQRGVVVFSPTVDDVLENYEIRIALETLATELAAKRIDDDELREIDAVIEQMRSAEGADHQALNRELHRLIYAAADRQRLAEIIESLRDVFESYVSLDIIAGADHTHGDQVRAQHEAIVEALHDRDPVRARALMEEHLESNRAHIARSVELLRAADAARADGSSLVTARSTTESAS
jgi:DNA-binding GntR family transcriptional regulator